MQFTDEHTEYKMLYNHSTKPYSPSKSFSTCKQFTNSYPAIKKEFQPTELKQLVPPKGIEPLFPRS